MRDLVRHVAGVHHWAAEQVGDQRVDEINGDLVDIVGGWPDDTDLLDWAAEQHRALVRVLETADRGFPYFTFLPGDTPFTMWVRRQAHETAIHRADAYLAAGWEPGFDAALAADGLDELLLAMIGGRPGPLPLEEPHTVHLIATDVDRVWTIVMSADGFTTHGERRGNADVTLRAPSDRLYLAAWHRREDGSTSEATARSSKPGGRTSSRRGADLAGGLRRLGRRERRWTRRTLRMTRR